MDELLIEFIQKKRPELLEIYKCKTLVLELNALSKIDDCEYSYSKKVEHHTYALKHFHPNEQEKIYHTALVPEVSRVFYFLKDKELACYKVFTDLDSEKVNREMSHLFTHTFF